MSEIATELTEKKKIRCLKCGKETDSEEPVFIKKSKNGRYFILLTCAVCKKNKSISVGKEKLKRLPKEHRDKIKELEADDDYKFEGGLLPLLPLLGAIFSGIAAASTATGAIANTVISNKRADEEKRHNEEREKIMREAAKQGSGLSSVSNEEQEEKQDEKQEQEEETPRNHRSESDKILRYSKYLETHLRKEEQIKRAIRLLDSCGYTISMEISSDSGPD